MIQLRFQYNEYQFTIYWCDVYNIWQYIDCESNKIIKLFISAVNIWMIRIDLNGLSTVNFYCFWWFGVNLWIYSSVMVYSTFMPTKKINNDISWSKIIEERKQREKLNWICSDQFEQLSQSIYEIILLCEANCSNTAYTLFWYFYQFFVKHFFFFKIHTSQISWIIFALKIGLNAFQFNSYKN